MLFCDFSRELVPLVCDGKNQDECVQMLFDKITDYSDLHGMENPVSSKSYSSYRMYYSGIRKINEFARVIVSHVDKPKFSKFIETLNDDIQEEIARRFSPHKEMDKGNVPEKMADLFFEILLEASNNKGKAKRQTTRISESYLNTSESFLLEREILIDVIKKLAENQLATGKYDVLPLKKAVRVSKKIVSDDFLCGSITDQAVRYYKPIQRYLKNLQKNGKVDFENLQILVRTQYKKLLALKLSQKEVFQEMVNWTMKMTKTTNSLACSVIVSFFVQDCEVFDVVAK